VVWSVTAEGPAHERVFTARVDAAALRHGAWRSVHAEASAAGKSAARTMAAADLTAQLGD
jgi:hypothetical protein